MDVIGWELTVLNATAPLLAEARTHMDKEDFNRSMLALNTSIASGADGEIALALQNLIPHFETLDVAAREVLAYSVFEKSFPPSVHRTVCLS